MDTIEIKEHIGNLSWDMPQYIRDYAVNQLVNINDKEIHLLLQPISKSHWEGAALALKKIGYPRVKGIIPGLLEWIQDMNCPGAQEIVDLLVTIDAEIVPHVKQVLKSGDGIWVMWVLSEVVSKWDTDLVRLVKEELFELAVTGENELVIEGVDIQSMKLLYENGIINKDRALSILKRKMAMYQDMLDNLEAFNEEIGKNQEG
jgi:hypothetical protein